MEVSYIPVQGLFFVGNGLVAMGGVGADIQQLFAPIYSLPSVMSLRIKEQSIIALNHRIRGSACYQTALYAKGKEIGQITDFTHPTLPVFIRSLHLTHPVCFVLDSPFETTDNGSAFAPCCGRLFEIPQGTPVFSKAKTDKETYCQLLLSESCRISGSEITFPAGKSHMIFVGGEHGSLGTDSFANCMELAERMRHADKQAVFSDCLAHWQNELSKIQVNTRVSSRLADAGELMEAVAVALLTQTAKEGGTIAGAFYHLAYGRDMYGVFRGFMALGLYDHARRMLCYLTDTYRQKGYMPNASGLGMSCAHRHENDEVEQTGYYLLELLEYVKATDDPAFLAERMDYARYLLCSQEKHLAGGMLPFNGDETYIAGGIFPRTGIDHGSMEATALYVTAAQGLLDLCSMHGLMAEDEIAAHLVPVRMAADAFAKNFIAGDTVYINQPKRLRHAQVPLYRHGVCLGCSRMTNLSRDPRGSFLCPACFGHVSPSPCTDRYSTDCAIWMSVFAGSTLLPPDLIRKALIKSIDRIRQSDYGKACADNTVGYEYGVMLYALAKHLPAMELVQYQDLLDALIEDRVCGAVWVEYYREGRPSPSSCPYRPWESAINLCGILAFLQAQA